MDGSELMSHERESRRGVAHAGSLARLDLDVIAASSANVCILISGPGSPQGVARRIHGLTRARQGRFLAVDCGWPEALLDQQLFHAIRPGSSGTVFLEEIGRLSPELQDRLLQTLDAPPDPRGPRAPRARVMASTSEALVQRALEGSFNDRLFYRLNAIHVVIPPDLEDW
jgi:DNA-binding NtrC family response regulator